MTRRQFITCLFMAIAVLACFPLMKFVEWGEKWFGRLPSRSNLSTFDSVLKKYYSTDRVERLIFDGSPMLRRFA